MAKVQCERTGFYTLINEKAGFNTKVRPIQPYYTITVLKSHLFKEGRLETA